MPKDHNKPTGSDFQDFVNAAAIVAEAQARLDEMQTRLTMAAIDAIDGMKDDFAKLQEATAKAEQTLELLALRNRENWFKKAKTLKVPYGTASFRSSTKIEVQNEELTIALMDSLGFDTDAFTRKTTALNLEALETLSDEELASLRVKRVTTDNFTFKPSSPDLGKAVAAAAEAV